MYTVLYHKQRMTMTQKQTIKYNVTMIQCLLYQIDIANKWLWT